MRLKSMKNGKPKHHPNERLKHNLDSHKRNWLKKCIRTKKWPIMEKCDLMKEIGKCSSTVKIWRKIKLRVTRSIS